MTKNTETLSGAEAVQAGFSHSKTIEITMAALFIALTYVATAFINVRIPFLAANGGLIHLGNIPLFVAAAFGMGLFDLTSGWVSWAPFTFVICGLIGFAFAVVAGKKAGKGRLVLAVFVAALIKVVGYYIAEIFLYGSLVAPVTSIPGNLVQIFVAGVIAVPVILVLQKVLHN